MLGESSEFTYLERWARSVDSAEAQRLGEEESVPLSVWQGRERVAQTPHGALRWLVGQ